MACKTVVFDRNRWEVLDLNTDIQEILDTIRAVTGPGRAELHEPDLDESDAHAVYENVRSGMVSSVGPQIKDFEDSIASFSGAKYAIATSSGTTALQIALAANRVESGHEVLVPAMTFAATASAVVANHSIPHFIDIDHLSLGVDPEGLRDYLQAITTLTPRGPINKSTGRKISALVVVHTCGYLARMKEILSVAEEFGLKVIEDAAAALGSTDELGHAPSRGSTAIFSFNGNKIITTGGGGAIVTDSWEVAERARSLSSTARVPHPWEINHLDIGFNFRMPSLNASLGISQMAKLPMLLRRKRSLSAMYQAQFAQFGGGKIFQPVEGQVSNFWLNLLLVNNTEREFHVALMEAAHREGLMLRRLWTPLDQLKPYRSFPAGSTAASKDLFLRTVCLPSSPHLFSEQVGIQRD